MVVVPGALLPKTKENAMSNLTVWKQLQSVPNEAKKEIKGGRLSGMTDISPLWRYRQMTETFGPVGFGWKFEVIRFWTDEADVKDSVKTRASHVHVRLWVKVDGEWSAGIDGVGGSMLVASEKNGLYHSDEAYKMALTDALSVAMKVLGLGADVYWFKGSKYSEEAPNSLPEPMVKAVPKVPIKKASALTPVADKDEDKLERFKSSMMVLEEKKEGTIEEAMKQHGHKCLNDVPAESRRDIYLWSVTYSK